jgi:hypothetical protein
MLNWGQKSSWIAEFYSIGNIQFFSGGIAQELQYILPMQYRPHSYTCVVHLELASAADLFLELFCLGVPQGVLEPVHSDPKDEIS